MPLMIIGTYRHTDLDLNRPFTRCLASLCRARHAVEIPLPLLSREEVEVLLSARAGQSVPNELVGLIYSETDGNPFFVEEMFLHLHQAGKLFDDTGQWLSGIAIGETEVPRGVQRVIGRRLERLSVETRRILATAAVIGRTFTFDLLSTVSGGGDDAIFDALEHAQPMGLISGRRYPRRGVRVRPRAVPSEPARRIVAASAAAAPRPHRGRAGGGGGTNGTSGDRGDRQPPGARGGRCGR
jgi:predicted ATPase